MDKHWPGWRKVDSVVDTSTNNGELVDKGTGDTVKVHLACNLQRATCNL